MMNPFKKKDPTIIHELGGSTQVQTAVDAATPLIEVSRAMMATAAEHLTDTHGVISSPLLPGQYVIEFKYDIVVRRKS